MCPSFSQGRFAEDFSSLNTGVSAIWDGSRIQATRLPDRMQGLQEIYAFVEQPGGNAIHPAAPAMPLAEFI